MHARMGLVGLAIILFTACGNSIPTGSSELPFPKAGATAVPAFSLAEPSDLDTIGEDFSCAHVEEKRARFSFPGFVEGDRVGFYVFFSGVPEGPKRLRIWWDYGNDPATFQDERFPEMETVLEKTYEHRYSSLSETTEFLVRVELILDGLTGNCARNRPVTVSAPGVPSGPAAPAPPATQTANVGPPVSAVSGPGFGTEGVRFTVLTTLTIDSVEVDVTTGGTLTIEIVDAGTFAVLISTTVPVSGGVQQIPLGFNVPPGDFILCKAGTATLGATEIFGGVTYPFTIAGVVSLTDTAFGLGVFGFYYYFYDWQVTW